MQMRVPLLSIIKVLSSIALVLLSFSSGDHVVVLSFLHNKISKRTIPGKGLLSSLHENGKRADIDAGVNAATTYRYANKLNNSQPALFVGFDLGTSGARISVLQKSSSSSSSSSSISSLSVGYNEIYSNSIAWKDCVESTEDSDEPAEGQYDDPDAWLVAIKILMEGCILRGTIASICVSGTSASCLVVDRTTLEVTRNPRMYDYDILTSNSSLCDSDSNSDFGRNRSKPKSSLSLSSNYHGLRASKILKKHLPPKHTARSHSGSFAKLIKWILESPLRPNEQFCHQADYVSSKLLFSPNGAGAQIPVQSDWHNCLKLGYDVRNLRWPFSDDWMESCLREATIVAVSNDAEADIDIDVDKDSLLRMLPTKIMSPGMTLGTINEHVAKKLGLSKDVIICAGTTDSNAAFFAAAAAAASGTCTEHNLKDERPMNKDDIDNRDGKLSVPYGAAVTSLGSTTAIKFLSKTYVEDSNRGVYSHRFPSREVFSTTTTTATKNANPSEGEIVVEEEQEAWLVGGASNVGCAIFRALNYTDAELQNRSMDIDPTTDSETYLSHRYYPLLPNKIGERFPIADSTKRSVLEPLPDSTNRTEYLKGLFQSISTEVELKGYEVFKKLGSDPAFPTKVMTAGGGSKNKVWTAMRQRIINDGLALNYHDNRNDKDNDDADADFVEPKKVEVQVRAAQHSEASYGAALLAASGFRIHNAATMYGDRRS